MDQDNNNGPLVKALTILNDDIVGLLSSVEELARRIGALEERMAFQERPEALHSLRQRVKEVVERVNTTSHLSLQRQGAQDGQRAGTSDGQGLHGADDGVLQAAGQSVRKRGGVYQGTGTRI